MRNYLIELYRLSIDGINPPMVKTPTFSPEEKKEALKRVLTGNKPLTISLGLSIVQLRLEWNVCNLNEYFDTLVNKSLLKAICDKLQGEEVNTKELNLQVDEYSDSAKKCVEYLRKRLKISNIECSIFQDIPFFVTEFNNGKRGFIHLVCRCEQCNAGRYVKSFHEI